jgi:hypothetical protein
MELRAPGGRRQAQHRDLLGNRVVAESLHVPAREGRAVRIEAGRRLRVIDLEGGQVADTVSACPQDIVQINEGKPSPLEIELL